ncbi:hypothetical protein ACKVMT_00835 [Halobacteriales archaeon Cl-PHB]
MRTVEDDAGTRYLLLKESHDSCLVRDLESGERRHLPTATLETVDGESPLHTAAGTVTADARDTLPPLPDQALGLLVELVARDGVAVRELLAYDVCESDLHGLLGELRAAGLVRETRIAGERGYEPTETAAATLQFEP